MNPNFKTVLMLQENRFYFSRRSGTGALILLALLLSAISVWQLLPVLMKPPPSAEEADVQLAWERWRAKSVSSPPRENTAEYYSTPANTAKEAIRLAFFDPNTATEAELRRLGLPGRTAATLIKYRSRGGRFRRAEDLQKLYTLSAEDYARIRPYVRIADGGEHYTARDEERHVRLIELNGADAVALQALRGIGPAFSRRIINFRNALGGFVSVEQLQEVYGLPDSTYQHIKGKLCVNKELVRLIPVNTAAETDLARHPYIGRAAAAAIVKLRNELGRLDDPEHLRRIPLINDEKYRKIAPYLSTH